MVVAAQGREVAQAGLAAGLVGEGVVWLALGGGTPAAREHARGMPDLDPVPQRGRGPVGGCFPGMITPAGVERSERVRPGPIAGPGPGPVAGPGRWPAA